MQRGNRDSRVSHASFVHSVLTPKTSLCHIFESTLQREAVKQRLRLHNPVKRQTIIISYLGLHYRLSLKVIVCYNFQ